MFASTIWYTKMHGFKYEFSKFFWGGAHRAPPQTPYPAQSQASPSILGRLACSVRAASSIYPSNMFNNPIHLTNWGVLDQTLFSPNPNFLAIRHWTQYIVPRLRSWINLNIPVIISLTAGWEDFLKIQRDERVILEHTVLGIIAPEACILVQKAPKSLAAEAPPQTPLGELTALPQTP